MSDEWITITGAREHNLKGIDVQIPRDRLTVVTGLSGSGKSSLAFDTLFAEGQRRYVESLSAYARQFLDQLQKPGPVWPSCEQRDDHRDSAGVEHCVRVTHGYEREVFAVRGSVVAGVYADDRFGHVK